MWTAFLITALLAPSPQDPVQAEPVPQDEPDSADPAPPVSEVPS